MQQVILISVDTLAELADLQMNGNFLCRVAEDGNVYRGDPEGGPAIKVLDENAAIAINDLTDVTISAPSNGQVLKYNGSAWVNDTGGGGSTWGGITGTLADQTDLQTALNGKAATVHSHVKADITDFAHTHPQSDITNLTTDLAGKAATVHSHAISDTTGLQTALDGKQATLVSATNIKTVNGASILGSGNLSVSSGYHFVATLASDQATGANVTPVTLTGLVFSYAANSMYRIWFMGRVQPTAATTGCGFQFDLSSAVTSIDVMFDHQLANTGTITGGHSIADDASVGVSSGMPGTSTYPIRGEGLLRTGANAGTAQLRFRSETTAVTTCKAGFTLVIENITIPL